MYRTLLLKVDIQTEAKAYRIFDNVIPKKTIVFYSYEENI
jgi:hypothetical protein